MSCQKIRSALNKKNILEPTGFSDAKRPVLFRPGQCVVRVLGGPWCDHPSSFFGNVFCH
jgi:hypothetical protein